MLKILKWSTYYFTWILLLEILHFLPLIDIKVNNEMLYVLYQLNHRSLWQLTDRQMADTTIHQQCFFADSRLIDMTIDRHDKSQTKF